MADAVGGPTVLRLLLGAQLRRLRESQAISAHDAAQAIRGSESKISRIELGRNAVREIDIADLLSLYGIADKAEREQLLSLASRANQPGWWHRYHDVLPLWFQAYIGLEESAQSIRSYDAQFVPGLPSNDTGLAKGMRSHLKSVPSICATHLRELHAHPIMDLTGRI